jgi:hypothetical protein
MNNVEEKGRSRLRLFGYIMTVFLIITMSLTLETTRYGIYLKLDYQQATFLTEIENDWQNYLKDFKNQIYLIYVKVDSITLNPDVLELGKESNAFKITNLDLSDQTELYGIFAFTNYSFILDNQDSIISRTREFFL